jgi:hypothetical protein
MDEIVAAQGKYLDAIGIGTGSIQRGWWVRLWVGLPEPRFRKSFGMMAGTTGLEPAASAVTEWEHRAPTKLDRLARSPPEIIPRSNFRQPDSKENAAIWMENSALREAAFGNYAEARQTAAAGIKLAPASQGVGVEAALAYAMSGDTAKGELLAQDINKRFPVDTHIQSLWLPSKPCNSSHSESQLHQSFLAFKALHRKLTAVFTCHRPL